MSAANDHDTEAFGRLVTNGLLSKSKDLAGFFFAPLLPSCPCNMTQHTEHFQPLRNSSGSSMQHECDMWGEWVHSNGPHEVDLL